MASLNQVVRLALSDLGATPVLGVTLTTAEIAAKLEAGPIGLLFRGSTAVGGVCHDYSGNIYVTDYAQHCVLKIDEGGRISIVAGLPGTAGNNSALMNVAALSARFNGPQGICCDKSGAIYVADTDNHQIRVIKGGRVSLLAGDGAQVSGFVDGVGAAAKFHSPTDVAVDKSGTVYVADAGNHAIRKIINGSQVLTISGNINAVSGTDADAENVRASKYIPCFRDPYNIAVDLNGDVYVLDTGNRKIKKITKNGWVYLLSGSGVNGRSLGTTPYNCSYNILGGCDCDESGNLYVLDVGTSNLYGGRLLKVDYRGIPSVIAEFDGSTSDHYMQDVCCSPGQKIFVCVTTGTRPPVEHSSSSSSSSYIENWSLSSSSSSSSSEAYSSSSSSSSGDRQ